jgi:hypothetical protein
MLRNAVLALGGALFLTGAMGLLAHAWGMSLVLMVWGVIIIFGILYERYVYKTIVDKIPAGKGWNRTNERFIDGKTGRTVTVYVKPVTGERAYVAENLAPAAPPPAVEG